VSARWYLNPTGTAHQDEGRYRQDLWSAKQQQKGYLAEMMPVAPRLTSCEGQILRVLYKVLLAPPVTTVFSFMKCSSLP
jgi:hypothetical protein